MMMKHECNVARDLMPLALDGAASDESQTLLHEHLEECAACREYFAGMRAALPPARAADGEQEQKAFEEAAQKMRKKRRRRIWRNVLIGVLAGAIVAGGSMWAWFGLARDHRTPVYHGEYNVFLSRLNDGSVSANVDFQGSYVNMSIAMEEYRENGRQILYISNYTSRFRTMMAQPMPNYSFTRLMAEDLDYFAEIREGVPGSYAVVWKAGDDIPAASGEMEAYFAIQDQLIALIPPFDENGVQHALSFEETQRRTELIEQLEQTEKTVPEWQ